MPRIHSLACVDSRAELADDVEIGPFCMIGPEVQIGAGTVLESHVVVTGKTTIGRYNRISPHTVLGGEPQDLGYRGAPTRTEIGDHNVIREGVTINRGAEKEDHVTRVGNHNLLMSNSHIAHNCCIRDHVILVNGVLLGGHVHVHDWAIVSGNTVVHHFSTLGTVSFVSGGSRVPHDIPPYMLSAGSDNPEIRTVNLIGLQRRGFSPETISAVRKAYKLLFREFKNVAVARELLQAELGELPREVDLLLSFIEEQNQGKDGRGRERFRRKAA